MREFFRYLLWLFKGRPPLRRYRRRTLRERGLDPHRLREWRKKVLKRDHYTCQNCGTHHSLQAHHLKSKTLYVELAYNVSNGKTLCRSCHKAWHREHGWRD